MLGALAGEGRRAGRAGELGYGARTCWAEREAGKELAQVWAARGGKERSWAGLSVGFGPGWCGFSFSISILLFQTLLKPN